MDSEGLAQKEQALSEVDGVGRRITARVLRGSLSRRQALAIGAASAVALQLPVSFGMAARVSAQSTSTTITSSTSDLTDTDKGTYFAETGHNLREPFYTVWKNSGGQSVLGLPLSEERYQDKVGVLQTFEMRVPKEGFRRHRQPPSLMGTSREPQINVKTSLLADPKVAAA
jgi:hypothetical protein